MLNTKLLLIQCYLILVIGLHAAAQGVVKKAERWPVVSTDYGDISAVRISDQMNGSYLLHFLALEPNSVLLPVVLNANMLFYVRAGSGKLSWTEEEELKHVDLRRGDIHRLLQGTVFYIRAEMQQERLKIDAIFANSNHDLREPATEPYSSIQEMVIGFDTRILQATFKVSEEVIDELVGGAKPQLITRCDDIVIAMNKKKEKEKEKKKGKEKKQARLFNVFEAEKNIENCNGWSTMVTAKQVSALEGSDMGVFMVNLTAGSMMGPHWNMMESEIMVVLEGRGVVKVISNGKEISLEVEKGDVIAVPRFQPMAQVSFNSGSFVVMGFTRVTQWRKPWFVAAKSSVLQILDRRVLELAFNVQRSTIDELLARREDSEVISPCLSCAEQDMPIEEEEERWWWRRRRGGEETDKHKGGEIKIEEGEKHKEGEGGVKTKESEKHKEGEGEGEGGVKILLKRRLMN